MDISGYQTDFVTFDRDNPWHAKFAASILKLWPQALTDGVPVRSANVFSAPLNWAGLEEESEIIPFSRDADMENYWEENGYAPMPDGEGPFSVIYQVAKNFECVVELISGSQKPTVGYEDIPYRIRIATPFSVTVSLITSTDPTTDRFSAHIVELLTSSLLE